MDNTSNIQEASYCKDCGRVTESGFECDRCKSVRNAAMIEDLSRGIDQGRVRRDMAITAQWEQRQADIKHYGY